VSVLNDYQSLELKDFRGPNLLVEPTDVRPPWALEALNCEYEPGSFRTRHGFYEQNSGLVPGGLITGVYNYIYGTASRLIWSYTSGGAIVLRVADYNGVFVTNISPATTLTNGGVVFAQYGRWMYSAQYNTSFEPGTAGLSIIDMEDLTYVTAGFKAPYVNMSSGVGFGAAATLGVTPGPHTYAVIFEDRSGFQSRPSPVFSAAGFPPAYGIFNTASTGQQVTITYSPTTVWPTDFVKAYLVMSSATNSARLLYVPIPAATVAGGAATPFSFVVNTPDSVLNLGSDIGDQEELMTYDYLGAPPFRPNYVFAAGARMGYLAAEGLLVSDPENPQRLVPDLNVRTLPQERRGVCAKYIQGTIYVFGPDWTYAITDNGDTPNLWAPWRVIDEKIGTSHPYGISVNDTGFGFVAHRSGLYAFSGGQYARLPISYFQQPLWDRIDWTALNFSIAIDAARFQVQVTCQDRFGVAMRFMWDYSEGTGPTQAKFSSQSMTGRSERWGLMVLNRGDGSFTGQQQQLWIAPADAAQIWLLRRHPTDLQLYVDRGASVIATTYAGAYLPGSQAEALVYEHHGLQIRAAGSGDLRIGAYKLDRVTFQQMAATALTTTPERMFTRMLDLRNEAVSYKFQNGVQFGNWIRVSYLKHFYTPYIMQR
jgi:hypothetical protein